jgi:hypothetical protein
VLWLIALLIHEQFNISIFTYTWRHRTTNLILIGIAVASFFIEFYWKQVVYNRSPVLHADDERKKTRYAEVVEEEEPEPLLGADAPPILLYAGRTMTVWKGEGESYKEFTRTPVFYSTDYEPDRLIRQLLSPFLFDGWIH